MKPRSKMPNSRSRVCVNRDKAIAGLRQVKTYGDSVGEDDMLFAHEKTGDGLVPTRGRGSIPYMEQGDLDMLKEEALARRMEARNHPKLTVQLRKLYDCIDPCFKNMHGAISKTGVQDTLVKFMKALYDENDFELDEARAVVAADWKREMEHGDKLATRQDRISLTRMTENQFLQSLRELVDQWTEGTSVEEYCSFMTKLAARVAIPVKLAPATRADEFKQNHVTAHQIELREAAAVVVDETQRRGKRVSAGSASNASAANAASAASNEGGTTVQIKTDHKFFVGDLVNAAFQNSEELYPGIVFADNQDGTYGIQFDSEQRLCMNDDMGGILPADAPVEQLQAAEVMLLQSPAGRKAESLAKERLEVAEASLENHGSTEADDTTEDTSFRMSFQLRASRSSRTRSPGNPLRNAMQEAQSEIQHITTHEMQSDIKHRRQSLSVSHADKLYHDMMTEAAAESAAAAAAVADKEAQAEVQAKTESAVVADMELEVGTEEEAKLKPTADADAGPAKEAEAKARTQAMEAALSISVRSQMPCSEGGNRKLEQAIAGAAVQVDQDQSNNPTCKRKTTRRRTTGPGTGSAKANIAVLIHLQRLKNKAKAKLAARKAESDLSIMRRRKSCTDADSVAPNAAGNSAPTPLGRALNGGVQSNVRLMKLSEGHSSSGSSLGTAGSMEEHLPPITTKDGQKSKFKVSSLQS